MDTVRAYSAGNAPKVPSSADFPPPELPLFELRLDRGHDLIAHIERVDQGIEAGAAGLPVLSRLDQCAGHLVLVSRHQLVRDDVRAPLPQRVRDGR